MNYVYFFGFYFFLFFIGRSIVIILDSRKEFPRVDEKIFGVNIYIFYPVLSLFALGNLAVITNFFMPVNSIYPYFWILSSFLVILNFKNKLKIKRLDFLITNFVVPSILSISSYKVWLHYDAGLYHLNNQLWISSHKIIFGLGNVNMWFSWSSIYEYISSLFWFGDNFIFLHFLNIIFFTLFFNFVYFQVTQNKNKFLKYSSLNLILFSILDNFGINGGGNGFLFFQTIGKPDLAFAVIFYISFILLIDSVAKNNFSFSELILLFYSSLFAIQLKAFGLYLIPLLIFYVYKLGTFKNILKKTKLLSFLSLSWVTKNIIISGCIQFPFDLTCFDSLSWYSRGRANIASAGIAAEHVAFTFDQQINDWFTQWIEHSKNFQIYTNFAISFLFLFLFNLLVFKKKKSETINSQNFIYIYGFLLFFSWLTTAPNARFGMIVCLVGISLLRFTFDEKSFFKILINKKIIIYSLISISILLTPRFYAYQEFFNNPLALSAVKAPIPTYLPASGGWGVYPKDDNRCWVRIDCMDQNKKIYPENIGNYILFKSEIFDSK
tara:strand:+ start:536 stop:2185 length:1650 start_codon:yes stop_codon:yes gene_type:complete